MDRQAIKELVDFLRNQEPPPENFMSIPDDLDDADDRGRWLKLKHFANPRSKSAPKRPKPLRLPDSAVAGRTIGGHRHIAISIPVEHSPFGTNPSSQYPVYNKDAEHSTETDSIMRFTDSNGVVTVLRTVSESQESPATDAFSHKPRRPVSVTNESSKTSISRTQSLNEPREGHVRDYSTASLPPSPLTHSRSCHLGSHVGGNNAGWPTRTRSPTSPGPERTAAPVNPVRPRPMPRSWTVFPTMNRGPSDSIDGVMYGQRRQPVNATAAPPRSRAASYTGRPRSNTGASTGSYKTGSKDSTIKSVPMIKVSTGRDSIIDWQGQVREAVADQEAWGRKRGEERPLSGRSRESRESRESRKEKVRQRKKRDIAASRASWERKKGGADEESLRRCSSTTVGEPSPVKADHESEDTDSASRSTMARSPSLTPVIVVADVKPSPPPSPAAPPTPASAPVRSTFTPPLSPRGRSPARSLQDGAFLSTGREPRKPCLTVRSNVSPGRLQPISPDRRAYEDRLREVEQRMRTLESSGDAWMKSMVPILDNLNRTLVKLEENRKFLGEGEEGKDGQQRQVKVKPKKPVLPMPRLTRRSTLNEKMLLDLRRIEKGEVDIIKDGSGLESVMRELQVTSSECVPRTRETAFLREKTGVAM